MAYSLRLAQEEQTALCLLQIASPGRKAAVRASVAYALAEARAAAAGVAYDVRQATGDPIYAMVHTAVAQQGDVVILGTPFHAS